MPRAGRVFIDNACNHIITRGNQKATVFKDGNDFEKYFMLVHKYKLKYGCFIYGYCFMPNHSHLILESPLGLEAMSRFMHCVDQSYAMSFNEKYKKVGHLWQGRYKSLVVMKDGYLFNLISYIEYNPVRAGLVSAPGDYIWSSYAARVLGGQSIILDDFTLGDSSEIRNKAVLR
jgi:putative transposase